MLRFDKLPLEWWWRPAAWPVWNHQIVRPVRFWSAGAGRDQSVFDALAAGRHDDLVVEQPAEAEELRRQLLVERDLGREHLADVAARFYEREWRRDHRGEGVHPEDHLWWATAGYLELNTAAQPAGG